MRWTKTCPQQLPTSGLASPRSNRQCTTDRHSPPRGAASLARRMTDGAREWSCSAEGDLRSLARRRSEDPRRRHAAFTPQAPPQPRQRYPQTNRSVAEACLTTTTPRDAQINARLHRSPASACCPSSLYRTTRCSGAVSVFSTASSPTPFPPPFLFQHPHLCSGPERK